jgi:transposase-like protein
MRSSPKLRRGKAGPLEAMYPVVFFDALRVKIRDEATVRTRRAWTHVIPFSPFRPTSGA